MSLRTTALAAALISFLFAGSALASVIRDDVPDSSYLALASNPAYDSVGRITFVSGSGSGSGVLIGQNWYLTAAHNVYSSFLSNTPGNVKFTVGSNTIVAQDIYVNPGYVSGSSTNGNDLALVRLSSPVTDVTPASLDTSGNEIGEVGTFVGFGQTGNGLTGATTSSSAKRGGTNVLDLTGDQFDPSWSANLALSDFDRPGQPGYSSFGSATPTPLESLVAVGDSGGGVFVDFGSGPQLVGLATFVLMNTDGINYGYGDGMAETRLSGHAAWIAETMAVPEPSSLSLAGAGMLLAGAELLRRIKRRGR